MSLINSYLENIIMLGSNLVIKYANEYFEYISEGVVCEIAADETPYIVLQINKSEEVINTRAFPRYDIYLASNIKPFGSPASLFSIVTNVSLSGMAFISKYEFDYSEENEIDILIPGQQKIYAKGKIIRKSVKKEYFDYSMQFTDMDDLNNNILSDYLSQLEDDRVNLQSYYQENIKDKL
jgi:hypothetical protein